jgi:hypothetical protein
MLTIFGSCVRFSVHLELGRGGVRSRPRALQLTHDQASVAWSHYHLRKAALEQAVMLRQPARALLAQVERATPRSLGQLGGRLYRLCGSSSWGAGSGS